MKSQRLIITKSKNDNKHNKPTGLSRAKLYANSKHITLRLSVRGKAEIAPAKVYTITVETESLLIAEVEARKALKGLGFTGSDIIDLGHIIGRGMPSE